MCLMARSISRLACWPFAFLALLKLIVRLLWAVFLLRIIYEAFHNTETHTHCFYCRIIFWIVIVILYCFKERCQIPEETSSSVDGLLQFCSHCSVYRSGTLLFVIGIQPSLDRIDGSTSTVGWAAAASADDIETLVAEGCAAIPESIEK